MNIIQKIEALPEDGQEQIMGLNIDELKQFADSYRSLLRSSRRVNSVMHGNPTYQNVAFTFRNAIGKADRLLYGEVEEPTEEEEEEKELPEKEVP